jgi:hypothetical protein
MESFLMAGIGVAGSASASSAVSVAESVEDIGGSTDGGDTPFYAGEGTAARNPSQLAELLGID